MFLQSQAHIGRVLDSTIPSTNPLRNAARNALEKRLTKDPNHTLAGTTLRHDGLKIHPNRLPIKIPSRFIFCISLVFYYEGLLGPQAPPRATRRTQNVAPGGQKPALQKPKSSQAATIPETRTQTAQRILHLPIAPRAQKTPRCGGVA